MPKQDQGSSLSTLTTTSQPRGACGRGNTESLNLYVSLLYKLRIKNYKLRIKVGYGVIKGDRVTLNIYKLSRRRKFDYYIVNELLRFLVFYYI